ncbi:Ig-like domain-containing protein, partial [Secundilactobacillus odoratitofui]|uniref:Ig-like domain-containing protein n=1 Tax=Secundilactobacillus odoratitofui TaxID=480930 RepID=UPI000B2CAF16
KDTDTDDYTVTGQTTPSTIVTIKDPDGNTVATGTSKPDGSVDIPVTGTTVKPGETLTVTPDGGKAVTVTVPSDVTGAKITKDTDTDDYTVTGQTTPSTNVTIKDPDGNTVATGTSKPDG